jgi:hypothetical protein
MHSATVELHHAFFWICDACGRDNFARAVTVAPESLGPDDRAEFEAAGFDLGRGEFTTRPDAVACGHCGAEFDVADPEED